jgi:hypothetical protein
MTSYGQKATTGTDVQDNVVYEGGLVTSDSLAAESKLNGGTFGANNPRVGVSKQPSNSTTSNVTDTSAAERLDPAPDAATRDHGFNAQDIFNKGRVEPYTHKPVTNDTDDAGNDQSYEKSVGSEDFSNDRQPASSTGRSSEAQRDSDFDDSAPNASFNNDIGGPNDPGRVAVNEIVKRNNENAGNSGRPRDMNVNGEGLYDNLKEEPAPGTN